MCHNTGGSREGITDVGIGIPDRDKCGINKGIDNLTEARSKSITRCS